MTIAYVLSVTSMACAPQYEGQVDVVNAGNYRRSIGSCCFAVALVSAMLVFLFERDL